MNTIHHAAAIRSGEHLFVYRNYEIRFLSQLSAIQLQRFKVNLHLQCVIYGAFSVSIFTILNCFERYHSAYEMRYQVFSILV